MHENMFERMMKMERKQAEKRFEKLCQYLELDKKQEKKARKLFKEMQKKTEKLAGNLLRGKLDQASADTKRVEIYGNYRQKFRKLLTEEQEIKYEQMRETGMSTDR